MNTVSTKPEASWVVSAVPTESSSARSDTIVENWAESATTQNPQKSPRASTNSGCASARKPITVATAPDSASAEPAASSRPRRSLITPPSQLPIAPAPTTKKVATDAHWAASSVPRSRRRSV